MREHQRLSGGEMWFNRFLIELWLARVGRKNHDHVRPCDGFRRSFHSDAVAFRFGARSAARRESDNHGDAGIAQVQRVRVSLRAVADYGHLFFLDQREIRIFVVVEICHCVRCSFRGRGAAENP